MGTYSLLLLSEWICTLDYCYFRYFTIGTFDKYEIYDHEYNMVVFIRQINLLDICNTLLCSLFERIATLKQLKMMSWRCFILSAKLGAKLSWRHKLWVTIWECYGSLKDQSHSHGCFFYFYCFAGLEVPSIAQSFSFQIQKTFTQRLTKLWRYRAVIKAAKTIFLYILQ